MGFLKDENKAGWAIGDWIFLVVLVGGGIGGAWYYTHAKSSSLAAFSHADSLFVQQELPEALVAYEALQRAAWKNDSLDSVLYGRLSELSDMEAKEQTTYTLFDSLLTAGDTIAALAQAAFVPAPQFLDAQQVERLKSATVAPAPVATPAPAPVAAPAPVK
jgi:hypothetical protein